MGNEPPKNPPKRMSMEDSLIEMKIQSKTLMRSAQKAEK